MKAATRENRPKAWKRDIIAPDAPASNVNGDGRRRKRSRIPISGYFRHGRDYELALAVDFLRRSDGIGSGEEAAAALAEKRHRR